ncbi:type II toxin-antitoxin system Phd/YefM family antitoxin [uncultured Devosia sp.]|uniref:type II toxin-antitoxin system Phd/YefM family antitoxin n=1 Tax=uncultured Devosia sp. TaxID=211434 RepID=UPI0035CC19CB
MATWQVQQAKSRLSEVIEKAQNEGPQTITKHGVDVAVVLSIDEYQRLSGQKKRTLVDHLLLFGPKFDDFELPPRQIDPPRDLNLFDDDVDGESAA